MFEKVNRSGLIIYLYYNRDAKTAGLWRYYLSFQNIVTCSFMFQLKKWSNWSGAWQGKFIKKVRVCHIQELETPFVGNLYR